MVMGCIKVICIRRFIANDYVICVQQETCMIQEITVKIEILHDICETRNLVNISNFNFQSEINVMQMMCV